MTARDNRITYLPILLSRSPLDMVTVIKESTCRKFVSDISDNIRTQKPLTDYDSHINQMKSYKLKRIATQNRTMLTIINSTHTET